MSTSACLRVPLGAVDRGVGVHRVLQLPPNGGGVLGAAATAHPLQQLDDARLGVLGQVDVRRGVGVCRRRQPAAPAEHVDVQQRVGAQPVGAVHRHAGHLARGEQPRHHVVVVTQHLRVDVGRHPAHRVVRGRLDRDGVGVRLDPQVRTGELGDVRELGVQLLGWQVREVQEDVVGVRPAAAPLTDLGVDRPGHHVARREVLDGGGVTLHEALAVLVAQDPALAAGAFGEQDAHLPDAGRVELVELHVLQRQALAVDDAHAVAGQRVGVRGHLEHLAEAAGREQHRLGSEDVHLAGRQLVRDDAAGHLLAVDLGQAQVQDVELVVEVDVVLHALLVERLQDHVAGAVGRKAGSAHRGLAVVAGVPTEPALVDAPLRGPVERQPHLLQVQDRVDGLLAHHLGGVLVDQVVAALDGVEGVPLPVVLLDVGQRRAHAALRRAGVRAGRVQLGQHRRAAALAGLQGGAHPGAAGADDDGVVPVDLHHRGSS